PAPKARRAAKSRASAMSSFLQHLDLLRVGDVEERPVVVPQPATHPDASVLQRRDILARGGEQPQGGSLETGGEIAAPIRAGIEIHRAAHARDIEHARLDDLEPVEPG